MMKNKFLVLLALVLLVSGLVACKAAPQDPLPRSMKGYELYSWQDAGQWHFTLITGTNRNKTLSEIVIGENGSPDSDWVNLHVVGVDAVKALISRLPSGEWLSWGGGTFITEPGELSIKLDLPSQNIIDDIKAWVKKCGLQFNSF